MTHFNLNRMLQGCSAFIQTMAGDRAARNDAKRVNNHVLPLTCLLLASSLRLTCPLQLRRIALILCVLVLSVGQMWGADYTIALTSFTESPTGTYTNAGLDGLKCKNYTNILVEVPSASASGTVSWVGSGADAERFLYIYKTNGTVKDETRKIVYAKSYGSVDFTSSDIKTNGGKYYLVFGTTDDWKAAGVKYILAASSCDWNINYITNGLKNGNASAVWSENNCFTQVGSTNEWILEDFEMPDVAGQFWVGPGEFQAPSAWGHSVIADLSTIKWVYRSNKTRTDKSAVNNMTGTLNIWSDGGDDNYHIGIYPDYQITYGEDGSGGWTKVDFNHVSGTEYRTEIVTAPAGYKSNDNFKYYVGLRVKDNGNTYWGDKSKTVAMNGMSGMSSTDQAGKKGQWKIYEDSGSDNYYCSWIPVYTLTYNANGGEGAPEEASVASDQVPCQVTISTTIPTRAGYTFLGWSTNSAADTPDTGLAASDVGTPRGMSGDVTLYAVWEIKTTTITLDKNNSDPGSTNGSATVTYGSSTLTSYTAATRTGYTLASYKNETSGGNIIIKADGSLNSGDKGDILDDGLWAYDGATITLYAQWTANKFDVTHTLSHVTRSSGGQAGENKATYGEVYSVVFAASSGYTLPATVTVTVGGSDVTANCTWNQGTGTLTIPAAYVTGAIVITVTGEAAVVAYATSIDFEAIIDESGTSAAWKTTMEGRNYTLSQADGGKWSLDGGDGGNKPADKGLKIKETGDNAGKITFTVRANQTVELKVGTLAGTGSGVAKFSTDGGSSYSNITGAATASTGASVVTTYTGATDRTYVFKTNSASWNILQHIIIGYKITYDKGANGTGTINPMYKTHGTNITLSSSPFTRDGYTQDGWSTSDGGEKVYELGASYTTDAPTTLYPHWVEDACTSVAAPTALTCSAHTSSSLTFTWTKADHASTYTAKLYSDAECTSQVASQDLGNVATVTFSTLSAETTYYCKVQSHGDGSTYCADGGTTAAQNGTTDAVPSGHTVTYKYNGATSGASPASATGASVTLPTPTRTDYELDGWYATDGTKAGIGGASYEPEADITLYARWQEACDAGGVAKSTADVAATGYTAYQEKGGDKVVFTAAPSLGFKYKDADGNTINNSTTSVVRNNAYKCQISSDSGNKGSIKTNSRFSNVDSISFYFAASDKGGCKIAVWCSTDDFSADSTQLLSATTYADNNSEFKLKTLAIPSGKKASALRFKFRFTVTSSGKISYIDSLKVYSSTSGGGTCYHVYYHGNGAESGYVNDTVSYTAGSKATVLNYNYGRYPLAKAGNDFQGWATSADGAVAYTAGQKIDITSADVDLYAVWATASTALVTWEKKVDVATWTDNTTPSTTEPTNIGTIGSSATLIASPSSTSGKTPQIQLASGASNADKGASFTFSMKSADKVVVPTKVSCEVANVGSGSNSDITYKAVLTDGTGNTYYSTNSICPDNNGTLNPIEFVFSSGISLRGNVTVKVYAWLSGSGSGFSFRMGPDVKFYGTVGDYACATPAAPTISGVSEYVPGQDITLTASHDGTNYDNLTTYTWYKGTDWATASAASPVQAAATGSSGYTLTISNCTTDNAGLYWCKVSNGTGCDAHNSEGYNIIVYPTYTITYNLNGGDWGEVEYKDSYTQFDEDYTLPTPTRTGYVFAGWYGASDFSGLPTVVLGSGSVGDKEYWAKWGAVVTVSWTVTKVDGELYRGGGGYSVKAVINETNWSTGFMDELELTATEGVTLKNIEVSENDESKVQVTADFDITTELAADATSITFTLNVPADGTYGPKVDEHEEDLSTCVGSPTIISIFDGTSDTENPKSSTNNKYKQSTQFTNATTGFKYELHGIKGDLIDISEATYTGRGEYTRAIQWGGASTSYYAEFIVPTGYTASITITYVLTSGSPKYIGFGTTKAAQANGSNYDINETISSNNVVGTSTFSSLSSGTYYYVCSGGTPFYILGVSATLTPSSGGITPTLTWDPALNTDADWDSGNDRLNKETGDVDFTFVAVQDKNSLGAITYSSSNTTVATVNAAGTVHIVGAAGDATIIATLAESGCFEEATATYNIHVEDNCIDVPGTISTEDLGCSGIQMTVSGHTALAGVSYQWYKDGVSLAPAAQEATYTTAAPGEYYVVVNNTGTDHCTMASTNTVTVEARGSVTITNIIDEWYVKAGRRTPDIALAKTTAATSFIVEANSTAIWNPAESITTGLGGCEFYMDANGIIYLKGTKNNGDATDDILTDQTLRIVAKDLCGTGVNSNNITIHRQAATTYKEIAFVVDGEKGKGFDQVTSLHADGTELYEYLDTVGIAAGNRLFKLTERNIYSTTDEKAIRQHYSQFDGILITDDPSTNTVVKKGDDYKTKGYVNAFGTMVDVRPIFTMEAYVSALTNWGSKGIKGNPQSPNPRQYEMRLECKDHEIYGAGLPDPEDGTNVWEEVIDGETFRHVILVDSTLGIYNGVAYNAETAGDKKPALQGFTGEAAGSLLGLGRILEGTLQAAIERQEEPAARLLVMGINAKALQPTCALTDEGKTVIKNILIYLLKTNMEEVDDCSNYFTGKIDNDWKKAENWSKNQLPSSEAKVRILAPCVISGIQPHVAQVAIVSSGESSIRGTNRDDGDKTCDGTLTIEPDGALIADGKVLAADAPHFAANDLKPTTPEDLIINTNGSAQAALIFNNDEASTKATVNYYSLGRKEGGAYQFQYFAVPMEYVDVNPAFAGSGIYTYVWHENGGWERRGYYTELYAFEGLGITTKFADPHTYTMKGTLASTAEREVTLTHESPVAYGNNIIGNSWMAPINIASLKDAIGDDDAVQKTVYIYSTGNDKAGERAGATSSETATAGQWLAIPIEAAAWDAWSGLKVIPAMQAFMIRANNETSLTLNYNEMVRSTAIENMNVPLRAPKRNVGAQGITLTRMRVEDSNTHTDMYLFEGERFNEEFDNGWEAVYMPGNGSSAQFYAMNGEDKMAVMATNDLEGTYVGFAPGKESNYTISFFGGEGTYYLNDLKEEKSTLIEQGNTYSFTYEEGDMPQRFLISTTPFGIPSVTTGVGSVEAQEKVQKVIYNDHVYIIRGGQIYDIMGKMIK